MIYTSMGVGIYSTLFRNLKLFRVEIPFGSLFLGNFTLVCNMLLVNKSLQAQSLSSENTCVYKNLFFINIQKIPL